MKEKYKKEATDFFNKTVSPYIEKINFLLK